MKNYTMCCLLRTLTLDNNSHSSSNNSHIVAYNRKVSIRRRAGIGRRTCAGYRALFANKVHVNVTKEASLP